MLDSDNKDCSVIGEDLIVKGDIDSKSDLVIEGRVEGNVSCLSLIVGKSGTITGDVYTEAVVVEGTIHGMVTSENVELKDGCTLEGDISSVMLAIDHGAEFNGMVRPNKKAGKRKIKQAAE